ncbi:hypothetical protein GTP91_18010 [Rugamonas sp. FT82W]|uniref:Uncharacterized protein n=2 Tax=Duganella vulcania TaxID=2692166 RepID=A0A845G894_9BURK|nr:hypothetical protein [Duganella vulcania]
MVPEAQILVRSAYEFLFFGAALIKDASLFDKLTLADQEERRKQAKGMLKSDRFSQTDKEKLNELGDMPRGITVSAYEAAETAGYGELYETVYRGMSMIASHGTIAATNCVFQLDDETGFGVVYGPSNERLEFTAKLVELCFDEGAKVFGQFLPAAEAPA